MTDNSSTPRHMSLVPYANDRDVVLRRGNAVVVYDASSRELSVRDVSEQALEVAECPYCHRPLRDDLGPAGEESHGRPYDYDRPFVDPDYFGMLARSQQPSPNTSIPGTPPRRLNVLGIRSGRSRNVSGRGQSQPADPPVAGAEFVGSAPSAASSQGISSSAFTPGYFKQFFREIRELGRGGNGVVLLVEHIMDAISLGYFACKRVPVGNDHTWLEKVLVEVKLLQAIPHKNLVSYHWVWLEDHQASPFAPSIPCLWILQEYCNAGDLHSYVTQPNKKVQDTAEELKEKMRRKSRGDMPAPQDLTGPSSLTLDEIFSFFRDITSGLHHLHTKGYIHRDLKPSNCLLQRDNGRTRVLISDFGETQVAGAKRRNTGATGTISYCAPEVLRKDGSEGTFGNFTTKSDIFSLGMIVYFMCFGRLPYTSADGIEEEREELEELRAEILAWSGFSGETRVRSDLPDKLYRFLRRLLSVDPNERPSTEEILASIKGGVGLHESALEDGLLSRVSAVDETPKRRPSLYSRAQGSFGERPRLATSARQYSGESVRPLSPVKYAKATSRPSRYHPDPDVAPSQRRVRLLTSSRADSPQQSPPLMLPPPPPAAAEASQPSQGKSVDGRVGSVMIAKVTLFTLKLVSLFYPCSPFATNAWLLYPLAFAAALDLGLPRSSVQRSMTLLAVHLALIAIAHERGRLCEGPSVLWHGV